MSTRSQASEDDVVPSSPQPKRKKKKQRPALTLQDFGFTKKLKVSDGHSPKEETNATNQKSQTLGEVEIPAVPVRSPSPKVLTSISEEKPLKVEESPLKIEEDPPKLEKSPKREDITAEAVEVAVEKEETVERKSQEEDQELKEERASEDGDTPGKVSEAESDGDINISVFSDAEEEDSEMDPEIRKNALAAAMKRMDQNQPKIEHVMSDSDSNLSSEAAASLYLNSPVQSPPDEEKSCEEALKPSEKVERKSSEMKKPIGRSWKGCPISEIVAVPEGSYQAVPVDWKERNHAVLFKVPLRDQDEFPVAHPSEYHEIWNQLHVHMPCSIFNVTEGAESRWDVIREAFSIPIRSVDALRRAVAKYNKKATTGKQFEFLRDFVEDVLTLQEQCEFFAVTLRGIIKLALKLPEIVTIAPPLLRKGFSSSVSLSQRQISCLLANAFLCTFPRRCLGFRELHSGHQYANYPDINFNRLFCAPEVRSQRRGKIQKLHCILNYFKRITKSMPTGVVTITRRVLPNGYYPDWEGSGLKLVEKVHVCSEGLIEVDGIGLTQMDFANKYVGGGVFGVGLVQEEIRFLLWPELIVTRLFTEVLGDNEVLVVTGVEQFSRGSGYANNFDFVEDCMDTMPRDEYRRRRTQILAVDAIEFAKKANQYQLGHVDRELNKCFAGFSPLRPPNTSSPGKRLVGIATGNWGCGAFKGDPRLKFLIQLMAASQSRRDGVAYFTFGNEDLRDDLFEIYQFLRENGVTVGQLYRMLKRYSALGKEKARPNLYSFLRTEVTTYQQETDSDPDKDDFAGPSSSARTPASDANRSGSRGNVMWNPAVRRQGASGEAKTEEKKNEKKAEGKGSETKVSSARGSAEKTVEKSIFSDESDDDFMSPEELKQLEAKSAEKPKKKLSLSLFDGLEEEERKVEEEFKHS